MDQSLLSTNYPGSNPTSPSNQAFPQDLFPLDFLSFVESSSPGINLGQPESLHLDIGTSGNGITNTSGGYQSQSYNSSPIFEQHVNANGRRDSADPPVRGGNSRGRARSKPPKRNSVSMGQRKQNGQSQTSGGHTPLQNGLMGMEVDQDIEGAVNGLMGGGAGIKGPHQGQGQGQGGSDMDEATAMRMASMYGLQGMQGMEAFMDGYGQLTGMSQGMLQQFEGIHMQSPIVFDPNNPSQPYDPMAQFLASPPQQAGEEARKSSSVNMFGGLITPGPSSEMYPQIRTDQMMSPMQLEMLARREQMEGMPDLNMVPLLSPAISQYNPTSQFASPTTNPTFQAQSPLEALQEQQRQFQEQLNALQVQQKQLQATAAAVAASTSTQTSPYIGSGGFQTGGSSGHSRPVSTPGVMGSAEPSPQFFSPLTSPALEATRQYQSAFGSGVAQRQPHPLSALSSPALNPLGSSGGAQQTLSPALNPLNNADLTDPDYLRALVGMLDEPQASSSTNQNRRYGNQQYHSPTTGNYPYQNQQSHSHQSSPLTPNHTGYHNMLGPNVYPGSAPNSGSAGSSNGSNNQNNGNATSTNGTGPHRQSLPAKSRPSPLVKPVNHRSHMRHPSTHTSFSQPSSPAILKGIQPGTYLPSAALDHKSQGYGGSGSLASTPSPVDLTSMMPPPPVPHSAAQKGLTPMTPAALMNLGGGTNGRKQVLPKPADAQGLGSFGAGRNGVNGGDQGVGLSGSSAAKNGLRKGIASGSGTGSGTALGAAGTPAPVSGKKGQKIATGKRLAAKPSGVGVRAATKGAAAAIQAPVPPEGENRRTSHKAAEQKRRDSLKAGFDELRLLLPPINTEALDPESGEPIPGSSAPRLLPKSSLVPDDNPNRGVSKVALLKFSNEYIAKLHEKVDKRERYIERLRLEVGRLRGRGSDGYGEEDEEEIFTEEGGDLLEYDIRAGEEEDEDEEGEEYGEGENGDDELVEGDGEVEGDEGSGETYEGEEDDDELSGGREEDEGMMMFDHNQSQNEDQRSAAALPVPKKGSGARPSLANNGGRRKSGQGLSTATSQTRRPGLNARKESLGNNIAVGRNKRSD